MITIKINNDHNSFDGDKHDSQVAKILHELANKFKKEGPVEFLVLRDVNLKEVGTCNVN